MTYPKYLLFLFLVISIAGCSPIITEETKKAIIERDPKFKEVLDRKTLLDTEISDHKAKLKEKTDEINAKINALGDELRFYQTEANKKIMALKSELNPERENIKSKIYLYKSELKAKAYNLKELKNSRKNLERLIKKNKDLEFSKDDVRKWESELGEFDNKIIPLEEDIKVLNDKIKFLKIKLISLKQ